MIHQPRSTHQFYSQNRVLNKADTNVHWCISRERRVFATRTMQTKGSPKCGSRASSNQPRSPIRLAATLIKRVRMIGTTNFKHQLGEIWP